MESPTVLVLVIVVLVVTVVGVMAVRGSAAERRRSRALAAWAQREGWSYDRERPELVDRFEGAPFLERRSNARARHVLYAQRRGRRVMAYEYAYTAPCPQHRNRTVVNVYTVVVVSLPHAVPELWVGEASSEEVSFPSSVDVRPWRSSQAEFDERFQVMAGDEGFARDVLDEATRTWSLSRAGVVPFRFTGRCLLGWQVGAVEVERVRVHADTLLDLLERLPAGAGKDARDRLG